MNNKFNAGRNRDSSRRADFTPAGASSHGRNGATNSNAAELMPLVETVLHRWPWLVLGGLLPAILGCAAGLALWKTSYTAPAQLIRYDSPNAEQVFGVRQAAPETLPSILHSPDLLQHVGAEAKPPVAADVLMQNLRVMPEHDSDIIVITLTAQNPATAVDLANLYAREAVRFTQDMQAKAANEVVRFATQQLGQIEAEIKSTGRPRQISTQTAQIIPTIEAGGPPSDPRIDKIVERYEAANDDLADLLARYTDAHPLVQAKRAEIAALLQEQAKRTKAAAFERESASRQSPGITMSNVAPNVAPAADVERDVIISKLQTLESARLTMLGRKQAAAALADAPPGYCQLLASATDMDLVKHGRKSKIICLTAFMGLLGLIGAAAMILLIEVSDNRLKSGADVKRVARLPLLAVMGDLDAMTSAQKKNWAFRTWTSLQGRLSPSPNHGLICGVTSSDNGEGRSTWVRHLAEAANQLGFRVLTVATVPASEVGGEINGDSGALIENGASPTVPDENPISTDGSENSRALATNVLASPAEVAQKLMGPEAQPIVHIPLPGWVWNLERRKQWQAAIHHWSQIENVVILVELPPAKQPEAVLLAQNLPNVVWLAASGKADAAETREHLETLRHARCHLAGAVLNRASTSIFQKRFCRWLNFAVVLMALNSSILLAADEDSAAVVTNQIIDANNQITDTNLAFSVVSPAQRAPWQQHLTLGPGDVLSFSLYSEPTLGEPDVLVAPDGRVSFLEARDIQVSGLTVDELRSRLDDELSKYRRAPHCIITPVAYNSKKYFVLGSVARGGVFTLDRPITIIEAVARARGLQTALQQRNLVEVADLQRAFLVRRGERVTVDFEKLFQQGDLSQNIPLAPNDYLFFPPADFKQVYVVGAVTTPGIARYTTTTSALRAIAEQGGFNARAWKKKVLVIRGSLEHPQTFVIDAGAVLSARAPDFQLQPDDIVYVHTRPWIKAEELLDLAASSFVQSAVISWTDLHVGPRVAGAFIQ
jgi:protein involved in polysaccharide export with SLBB domain/capsular polysaccharide biosynthesis protein